MVDARPSTAAVPPAASEASPTGSELLPGGTRRERAAARLSSAAPSTALDRMVALASRLLSVPSAQLSLLSDVQLVAGGAGDALSGTIGRLEDSLCTVTAAEGAPLVVTDAVRDARVAHLPPVTSGAVGAYLGVPVVGRDRHVVGALCAFGPAERTWSAADVQILTELAEAAGAELELAALWEDYESDRVRWELSMAAGGVGSFDWELSGGNVRADARLLELFGYDRPPADRTVGAFRARVHPDDVRRVSHALRGAVAGCGDIELECRVVVPGGDQRWVQVRGTVLPGPDGRAVRAVGAAFDTTRTRESDARLSRVLETMSAAFYSLDQDWRFTYVNGEAEQLLRAPRADLLGRDFWELFPAARGSDLETCFRGAVESGRSAMLEVYAPAPLNGWYELRVWPTPDGLSVYVLDVTARRTAQEATAAATRRLEVLAGVSEDLSGMIDVETAVAGVGRRLVPALADWCIVTLLDDHGAPRDVAAWHADPALQPLLDRYTTVRLASLHPTRSLLARAVASGRPAVVPEGATAAEAAVLGSDAARSLLADLAPESVAVLPLRARGRTSGLVTLARGAARAPLEGQDLTTAVEVTERVGLALDHARLSAAQQRIAEGLQRSMLTPPVEPVHTQVVVRYQPAAEAARVGGDWYDAFQQADGSTVLVIGDIVGHDIAAAAAMSQVRSLLRGIGYTTGGEPAAILSDLDAALSGLGVGTEATAVVARLAGCSEGGDGAVRFQWSNAGHPPPMLLAADGTVVPLAHRTSDLLLGVVPTWQRHDQDMLLTRGSTVLLYTDGLVERRGEHLRAGLDRLRDAVAAYAGADLDTLVDGVLARMLPGPPEDDIALAAVRLHPPGGGTARA